MLSIKEYLLKPIEPDNWITIDDFNKLFKSKDWIDFLTLLDSICLSLFRIEYGNIFRSGTKSFLFFKSYPKILPGSEIVVGKKPERAKLTSQEVLGISSGLSTLIIVLSTLLSGQ